MIRAHESSLAFRAGALSLLVHGLLLAVFLMSFNWKAEQPASIAEVELWDSLPSPKPVPAPTPPAPEPPKPEPVVKEEPKPEPPPQPEPKAEIVIKKKPPVEVKPREEKPKKEEKPKPDTAIKAKEAEKQHLEEIKKIQQMLAAEDQQQQHHSEKVEAQAAKSAQAAAASSSEAKKYGDKIQDRIYSHVNRQLCGTDKVNLTFNIALMPTGQLSGSPKLLKSSGIAACDEAIERAILQSDPFPKPPPEIFNEVRDLELKFRPNDDN